MTNRGNNTMWNEALVRSLRELWDQGLSTADIGRRLGMSMNAIIGKAHRLELGDRPSPIKPGQRSSITREAVSIPAATNRPPVPRLADIIPVTATAVVLPAPLNPVSGRSPKAPAPVPAKPAADVPGTPARSGWESVGIASCCWPHGDPGTPGFRFCDASTLAGKPYCAEHARLAYRRTDSPDDNDRTSAVG